MHWMYVGDWVQRTCSYANGERLKILPIPQNRCTSHEYGAKGATPFFARTLHFPASDGEARNFSGVFRDHYLAYMDRSPEDQVDPFCRYSQRRAAVEWWGYGVLGLSSFWPVEVDI